MTGAKVVTGSLHRVQHRHRKRFVTSPAVIPGPVHRPARVAVMLALAHKVKSAIADGRVHNQAEVARRLGFTRARLTHLLDLLLLAPDLQEQVLFLEAIDGREPMSERMLRPVARAGSWAEQRALFADGTRTTRPALPGR
jgi:hypothetical protein